MPTPVAVVDASGIHVPTYADCLAYFQTAYQAIYGADVYLGSDSQDGQWIALQAQALYDANLMAAAIYNQFAPSTALGAGLSSVVKVNGVTRLLPSNSTVDVTLTGTVGTTITGGAVGDGTNRWNLPASVTIPSAGTITVTATADQAGAIAAAAGAVTQILTPTRGWQSVTNASAATVGNPVEDDATLRERQRISTSLPSLTVLEGILGAVANLAGVTRLKAYENDTNGTDANGLPAHSIALVVDGGDANTIAGVIGAKKAPGTYTHGSTAIGVVDAYGVPHTVRFSRPTSVPISMAVSIKALSGYTSAVGDKIKAALAAYVNALGIAPTVWIGRLYVPANLTGADAATFDVLSITIARDGGTPGSANLALAWDEAPTCDVANITLAAS